MTFILNSLKIFGLLILSLICNTISILLLQHQDELSLSVKWGFGLAYIIFIALVLYFLWKAHKKHEPKEVSAQKMTSRDVGIDFLFFLAARAVAIIGTLAIWWLSGKAKTANDEELQSMANLFKHGFLLYPLLYVALVGVIGPIIEELSYRAFPDHLWFKYSHKVLAGIITTAIFALPHSSTVLEFLLYAGLGTVFYLAYQRRGNIKDSILVHIFNNLPFVITLLVSIFW
ncbi:CPBP family intramembrane glutamic endopeptidase [Streptococcus dentiloxodontae]